MLLSLKDLPVARCFLFCFGAAAAEAAASEMWKTWAARKKNWAAPFFLLFFKAQAHEFFSGLVNKSAGLEFCSPSEQWTLLRIKNSSLRWAVLRRMMTDPEPRVCLILSQSPASSNVMTSLTLSTEVHTKTGMHHVTPLSRITIKDRQQLP